jgi:hypothetical protein
MGSPLNLNNMVAECQDYSRTAADSKAFCSAKTQKPPAFKGPCTQQHLTHFLDVLETKTYIRPILFSDIHPIY